MVSLTSKCKKHKKNFRNNYQRIGIKKDQNLYLMKEWVNKIWKKESNNGKVDKIN